MRGQRIPVTNPAPVTFPLQHVHAAHRLPNLCFCGRAEEGQAPQATTPSPQHGNWWPRHQGLPERDGGPKGIPRAGRKVLGIPGQTWTYSPTSTKSFITVTWVNSERKSAAESAPKTLPTFFQRSMSKWSKARGGSYLLGTQVPVPTERLVGCPPSRQLTSSPRTQTKQKPKAKVFVCQCPSENIKFPALLNLAQTRQAVFAQQILFVIS